MRRLGVSLLGVRDEAVIEMSDKKRHNLTIATSACQLLTDPMPGWKGGMKGGGISPPP